MNILSELYGKYVHVIDFSRTFSKLPLTRELLQALVRLLPSQSGHSLPVYSRGILLLCGCLSTAFMKGPCVCKYAILANNDEKNDNFVRILYLEKCLFLRHIVTYLHGECCSTIRRQIFARDVVMVACAVVPSLCASVPSTRLYRQLAQSVSRAKKVKKMDVKYNHILRPV